MQWQMLAVLVSAVRAQVPFVGQLCARVFKRSILLSLWNERIFCTSLAFSMFVICLLFDVTLTRRDQCLSLSRVSVWQAQVGV